jgi:glucosamine--fructose-6-phosphate aminotransferase (isomerizing)
MAEKGGYRHFMLKEIHEQPRAVRDTLKAYASVETGEVYLDEWNLDQSAFAQLSGVKIVACGTSFHAGLIGKYMIETLAQLPVEVDYASEFRYRRPILDTHNLVLAITQSGETADTLAAVREAAKRGSPVVAITNVVGSTITREAQGVVTTHAGPEIGVASTKTFATQLVALYLLAIKLARWRGQIHQEQAQRLIEEIHQVPIRMEKLLEHGAEVESLARQFYRAQNFLYLGRGVHYPVALEGALKLKELSYIHAEGCAAGEMKHGPNALLDENLPVVVVNTHNREDEDGRLLYEKTLSNMQEVKARGAKLIALVNEADEEAVAECRDDVGAQVLSVPPAGHLLSPLLAIIPLQLLAYHIAVLRGCDVDQPRNLAKSVTVE